MKKAGKFLEKQALIGICVFCAIAVMRFFLFPDKWPDSVFILILPCAVGGIGLILLLARLFFSKKEEFATGVIPIAAAFNPGAHIIMGESKYFETGEKIAQLKAVNIVGNEEEFHMVKLDDDQNPIEIGQECVIDDDYVLMPILDRKPVKKHNMTAAVS